jgi:hypothetical protein
LPWQSPPLSDELPDPKESGAQSIPHKAKRQQAD